MGLGQWHHIMPFLAQIRLGERGEGCSPGVYFYGEIGRILFPSSQGGKQVQEGKVFSWHGTWDLMSSQGASVLGSAKVNTEH